MQQKGHHQPIKGKGSEGTGWPQQTGHAAAGTSPANKGERMGADRIAAATGHAAELGKGLAPSSSTSVPCLYKKHVHSFLVCYICRVYINVSRNSCYYTSLFLSPRVFAEQLYIRRWPPMQSPPYFPQMGPASSSGYGSVYGPVPPGYGPPPPPPSGYGPGYGAGAGGKGFGDYDIRRWPPLVGWMAPTQKIVIRTVYIRTRRAGNGSFRWAGWPLGRV